ncbi:MAG: hypothetical protein IPP99_16140 [Chitinophagaceae bacterium]|nr:hypothetical protein [Chitinophagaceae bacterium]
MFSYAGWDTEQKNFMLDENEEEVISIRLEERENLEGVIVTDPRERREPGSVKLIPKTISFQPPL